MGGDTSKVPGQGIRPGSVWGTGCHHQGHTLRLVSSAGSRSGLLACLSSPCHLPSPQGPGYPALVPCFCRVGRDPSFLSWPGAAWDRDSVPPAHPGHLPLHSHAWVHTDTHLPTCALRRHQVLSPFSSLFHGPPTPGSHRGHQLGSGRGLALGLSSHRPHLNVETDPSLPRAGLLLPQEEAGTCSGLAHHGPALLSPQVPRQLPGSPVPQPPPPGPLPTVPSHS